VKRLSIFKEIQRDNLWFGATEQHIHVMWVMNVGNYFVRFGEFNGFSKMAWRRLPLAVRMRLHF
jgi:hypothetical protein